MNELPGSIQAAYGGAATQWAASTGGLYRCLADALASRYSKLLTGARVLDVGAGAGATTSALLAVGARVTASDLTEEMLRVDQAARAPAAVSDILALPFRRRVFDAAVAAFVISHVPDPAAALRELGRVVRRGGSLFTVGFDTRSSHPAKAVIDDVLGSYGYAPPAYYVRMKKEIEPLSAAPDRLAALAADAGLSHVHVDAVEVETGIADTEGIVSWRLGLPAPATFMAGLDAETRGRLLADLHGAVGPDPEPLRPGLLILHARVA